MRRHTAVLLPLLTALLLVTAPMAASAKVKPDRPLRLANSAISVSLSPAQQPICDKGSFLNCGTVAVTATFNGLQGRTLPPSNGPRPEGNLAGTAELTRVYGCDRNGKRLRAYDRTVTETLQLNTRRGSGFTVPRTGDLLTTTVYGFPLNAEPGNCPADATPTTYVMKVGQVRLDLEFYSGISIPGSSYKVAGKARWDGAVPTPSTVPAS